MCKFAKMTNEEVAARIATAAEQAQQFVGRRWNWIYPIADRTVVEPFYEGGVILRLRAIGSDGKPLPGSAFMFCGVQAFADEVAAGACTEAR